MKPAGDPDTPRHWEKRVLAAYYRLLGSSQKAAGAAVVTALARRQLLAAMMRDGGDLALKILERIDTDLAPPTQRLKHQHEVGEGLSSLLKAFEGRSDADPG